MKERERTLFDVPWSGGNEALLATLDEIGMPKRLVNSMKFEGVVLVGAFVQLSEIDLRRKPGLGRTSLREAGKILRGFELSLGMNLWGWDDELAAEARKSVGRRLYRTLYELCPTNWEPQKTLKDELEALLLEVETARNAEMLSLLYGFNSEGPKTLESVGQPYGLTRERVRQIAAKAEKKLKTIWRPLSCLEAARNILNSKLQAPFTQKNFSEAAQSAGITTADFHVEGVLKALELFGEGHSICNAKIGDHSFYGTADEVSVPKRLLTYLRKETSANGCANIQRLSLLVGFGLDNASMARLLLTMFPEVHWLDSSSTWVLSKQSTRNRLANVAGRIFSASQSVEVNELRSALLRHVRVSFVPPPEALGNLLEFYGIAKVENRIAMVEAGFEKAELGVNDQGLVHAFKVLGSPATREQLEDYCIDQLGMNINSFYVYLSYSPLVVKLTTGVFSLVGQDVGPGTINQLKEEIKKNRFEDTSGWSKAGTLWWHLQADRPTAKTGTRAVPAFVFNLTSGE